MAPTKKKERGKEEKKTSKGKKSEKTRKGMKIRQYSEAQMLQAVEDVSKGLSIRKAALKNDVPRITLMDKIKKKSPINIRMGPATILSDEEESMIVRWLLHCEVMNFPVSRTLLLDSVQRYLQKKQQRGRNPGAKPPGQKWVVGFKRRHPEIHIQTARNPTQSRAAVTEEDIESWGNRIISYLRENGLDSILNEPNRVFNCDETAVFLNPKVNRVLARKGDKTVYQQANERECLTVLVTANAAGILAPPLVVVKYERIPEQISMSVPPEWGLGKSPESGWTTAAVFYEFIVNVFDPWLTKHDIARPVILFMDGHTSHVALHTSLFCRQNGIILVTLYPNSTHLTQPMDEAVFKSLKVTWKKAVQDWRLKNLDDPILRKKDFCPLMKNVLDNIPSSAIVGGFRTCGLVPWDPSVVINRLGKAVKENSKENAVDKFNVQAHWTALKVLEQTMGREKLERFQKSQCSRDLQDGSTEDMALFRTWKEIKERVFPPDLYPSELEDRPSDDNVPGETYDLDLPVIDSSPTTESITQEDHPV